MHVVSPSKGYIFATHAKDLQRCRVELDGPTEAVLFCEHAYLYEHSVIKLNSGREFPSLMHTMHPDPRMHSMMLLIQHCPA